MELEEQIENLNKKLEKYNKSAAKTVKNVNVDINKLFDLVDEFKTNSDLSNHTISDNMEKIENMLTEYNDNLTELNKTTDIINTKDEIKSLNDELYLDILDLFNSLTFDEEAEDIKDFLQNVLSSITVKTDANTEKLNNIMMQFKSLLYKVEEIEKTQNSISDYLKPEDTDDLIYSFEDIQTDLAKMRLVLNDISQSVNSANAVDELSEKIRNTANQIEMMASQIGTNENNENVTDIREKIEGLNEQINDISMRTNKLILTNEDSNIELKNNLEIFKDVFDRANPEKLYELFYELTHYFNDTNEKIIDVIQTARASHNETVTIKNALIHIGEWLDSATNVLGELRENTDNKKNDATLLKEIEKLKKFYSSEILTLNAKIKVYRDETNTRLDKLEKKIDKLLEVKKTTSKTSSTVTAAQVKSLDKKLDKLETVLTKLSAKRTKA